MENIEKLQELLAEAKLTETKAMENLRNASNNVDNLVDMLETIYLSELENPDKPSGMYSFEEEGELWFSEERYAETAPFGSATVMGYGQDLDYLALDISGNELNNVLYLLKTGWEYTGTDADYNEEENKVKFKTFRNGVYNLVIVNSYEDFNLMMKANDLCVKLKLSDKAHRIAVFDAICKED